MFLRQPLHRNSWCKTTRFLKRTQLYFNLLSEKIHSYFLLFVCSFGKHLTLLFLLGSEQFQVSWMENQRKREHGHYGPLKLLKDRDLPQGAVRSPESKHHSIPCSQSFHPEDAVRSLTTIHLYFPRRAMEGVFHLPQEEKKMRDTSNGLVLTSASTPWTHLSTSQHVSWMNNELPYRGAPRICPRWLSGEDNHARQPMTWREESATHIPWSEREGLWRSPRRSEGCS